MSAKKRVCVVPGCGKDLPADSQASRVTCGPVCRRARDKILNRQRRATAFAASLKKNGIKKCLLCHEEIPPGSRNYRISKYCCESHRRLAWSRDDHAKHGRRLPKPFSARPVGVVNTGDIDHDEAVAVEQNLRKQQLETQNKRLLERVAVADRVFKHAADVMEPLSKLPFTPPRISGDIKKTARYGGFLFATDHHWGIRYDSRDVGGLPGYDCDEATRRLKRCVDVTHMWTASGVYVPECTVFFGGDIVHALIHKSAFRDDDGQVVDQVLTGAYVYAQFFRDLARKFELVTIKCVPGNHGRVTEKPTSEGVYQNFDTLLYQLCKSLLSNQPNIVFDISDTHWAHAEIEGHGIAMIHGDRGVRGVTTQAAFPVNHSLLRSVMALEHTLNLQGKTFESVALGHFHTALEVPWKNGHIQINGSLPGVDPYSTDKGYFPRPPCQIFQLYSAKHGHASTHKIWVDKHELGKQVPYQFRNMGPNGIKTLP